MADAPYQNAHWMGIPMKHVSLITLTFQNSALILIMHYSRIMPLVGGHRYLTSTAVSLNEVVKLAACLTVALYDISRTLPQQTTATSLFIALYNAVFTPDHWKLAIPALLYTFGNSLQYIAVSNLDAATFQVTYQLKILTTALFSVTILGRSLSGRKWMALVLLTLGVAIVQLPTADSSRLSPIGDAKSRFYFPRSLDDLRYLGGSAAAHLTKRSATYEGIDEDIGLAHPTMNGAVGLVSVIIACVLSGLAGVYFEKVLKGSTTSLWIRNVQLSFYSLFPAFIIGVLLKDGEEIARDGFFVGYNWVVFTLIGVQAFGGIVVALCVNYADNIAKNFATSISIVISFVASVWFFEFPITASFVIGTSIVMFATYLYSSKERMRPPPIKIADFEKTTIGGLDTPRYEDQVNGSLSASANNMGLSTSRPNSPLRHHSRMASGRAKFPKRDE